MSLKNKMKTAFLFKRLRRNSYLFLFKRKIRKELTNKKLLKLPTDKFGRKTTK